MIVLCERMKKRKREGVRKKGSREREKGKEGRREGGREGGRRRIENYTITVITKPFIQPMWSVFVLNIAKLGRCARNALLVDTSFQEVAGRRLLACRVTQHNHISEAYIYLAATRSR